MSNPFFIVDTDDFDKELRRRIGPVVSEHGLKPEDAADVIAAVHEMFTLTGRALQDNKYGDILRGMAMVSASLHFCLEVWSGVARKMHGPNGKPAEYYLPWLADDGLGGIARKVGDWDVARKWRFIEAVCMMSLDQMSATSQCIKGTGGNDKLVYCIGITKDEKIMEPLAALFDMEDDDVDDERTANGTPL